MVDFSLVASNLEASPKPSQGAQQNRSTVLFGLLTRSQEDGTNTLCGTLHKSKSRTLTQGALIKDTL